MKLTYSIFNYSKPKIETFMNDAYRLDLSDNNKCKFTPTKTPEIVNKNEKVIWNISKTWKNVSASIVTKDRRGPTRLTNLNVESTSKDFTSGQNKRYIKDVTHVNFPTVGEGGKSAYYLYKDTFSLLTSLTEITLPGNVAVLEEKTFKNCYNLKKVTIKKGYDNLKGEMFKNCQLLEEIYLPTWGIHYLGDSIFQNCCSLKSINLPWVVEIGKDAFRGCTSLSSISMPRVYSIKGKAFWECPSLKKVIIPDELYEKLRGQLENIFNTKVTSVIKYSDHQKITVAPATVAPTTVAPTTVALQTVAPTTAAPQTVAPTTVVPTTNAPTTNAPTTNAPTTVAPTTVAPTTNALTTVAPQTVAPTTVAPTTVAPTTNAPTPLVVAPTPLVVAPTPLVVASAPLVVAPAPQTVAPTTVVPTTVAPTTAVPQTVAPTTNAPTTTFFTDYNCNEMCRRDVNPHTLGQNKSEWKYITLTGNEAQLARCKYQMSQCGMCTHCPQSYNNGIPRDEDFMPPESRIIKPTTQAPYVATASEITSSPYSIVPTNTSNGTLVFDDILYYVEKIDTISEDLEEELDINLSTHDLNLIVADESDINDLITNIKDNNIPYIFDPETNIIYIYSDDLTTTNENFTQQATTLQKPKVIIIKKKNIILPSNEQNCMQNTYYMNQFFTIILLFVLIFIILRVTQQTSFSPY